MSGQLALWGANEILKIVFGAQEQPTNYYVALIKDVTPNAFISGAELDEPEISDGYQRAVIPNTSVHWLSDDFDSMANANDVTFEACTTEWGTLHFWALCNAQVEGFVYACGDLVDPVFITALDQFVIPAGAMAITLGPIFTTEV